MNFSFFLSLSFLLVFNLVDASSIKNKTTNASLLLQCEEDVSDLKKTLATIFFNILFHKKNKVSFHYKVYSL
jgi:hypothetical protein